jgi:hypothetical protein
MKQSVINFCFSVAIILYNASSIKSFCISTTPTPLSIPNTSEFNKYTVKDKGCIDVEQLRNKLLNTGVPAITDYVNKNPDIVNEIFFMLAQGQGPLICLTYEQYTRQPNYNNATKYLADKIKNQ